MRGRTAVPPFATRLLHAAADALTGIRLAWEQADHVHMEELMGRILLGVIIGVILVIWLLASCVGAIF